MTLFLHILDRFVIHLASATSLVMAATFAIMYLRRRVADSQQWIPANFNSQLMIAALAVFAFSTMREAYDVSVGQPLVKAFTDYASWIIGTGVGAWGLYRIKNS
jgi:hypothetical protein